MVKMKSKNTLPPILGLENTNLIVVPPNFDPIYHSLTPRSPRARDKNSVISAPPQKSNVTTRSGDLGGTYLGQKKLGWRLLTKKWRPKTHHNLPQKSYLYPE